MSTGQNQLACPSVSPSTTKRGPSAGPAAPLHAVEIIPRRADVAGTLNGD